MNERSYLYDFGDGWEHELVLEDSHYFNPSLRTGLACLGGERACPPEDVGGVPGYFLFLDAMKDKNHEEHESYMEWYGGHFDRDEFSPKLVNLQLMQYLRWSRERHLFWSNIE